MEIDLSRWIKLENKKKRIESSERLLSLKRRIFSNSQNEVNQNKNIRGDISKLREHTFQDQIDVIDPLRVGKAIAEIKLAKVQKGPDLYQKYE